MRCLRALVLAIALGAVIASGWVDPKDEAFIGNRRSYWAFQKPVRPEAPSTIDGFLPAPTPPLDRARLLRRVTLDLTGLPPTPQELSEFLRDRSGNAYEKVVNRLLASPQYGERWALRWLDVVRYADTNGYELDVERPQAWRYRDYVVSSFNADKPYDRFVREQIAGDEIWPGNRDALIATGFHRAGPIHIVGGNQDEEMNRQEVLTEMAGAIGSVFMGLTVGCARCHNHKFDPILQADYYRLQAVFAATEGKDIEIATAEDKARYEQAKKDYEARFDPVKKQIADIEKSYRDNIRNEKTAKLEAKYLEALDTPEARRTEEQKRLAKDAKTQTDASWDEVVARLTPVDKERRAELRRKMHRIELTRPDPPAAAYAVTNRDKASDTYILKVGDYKSKMGKVEPGVPAIFRDGSNVIPVEPVGRRTALANWLASPDNPLTARVMVNRIWQFRMGTGLVATPNDFGLLGQRPTNQKLLDWLATEFVARNWSVKAMDRMIVLSSAYQQAGVNRRRLEGETIRDNILAVSGDLNSRMGGKPVRVPIEKEVYDLIFSEDEPDNLWPLPPDPSEQHRRSIYLLNKRTVRLPMLANFDQPDTMTSCPVRPTSTHALQALSLMNSDFMQEQAAHFAARLARECAAKRSCEVSRSYVLALARPPSRTEIRMADKFLGKGGMLADFCLAMLNRNEFVYRP
jgi:Protein of unknown function (DUF1549)/Protein of unknown function (DUF1553)